ncbi:DMT family transporter [Burkholderia sp. 22PA0099]|uniref:DMT family transporter n=1 Tax=Burkholderia sp. 22PA0099 TaxID=3237372 RepID=UPI0039C41DC0
MNYLFPLLAAVLWGGNTVVTKFCAASLSPFEISFYRWLLAAVALTPFVLPGVLGNWRTIRPALGKVVVLGLLGGVVYQAIAYIAAHYTSATNMGIIQALVPLIGLVLAMALLRHKTDAAALCGLAVSIVGVLLVVTKGSPGMLLRQGINRGDALMLVGVCGFALYGTLLHKWKLNVPAMQSVYLQAVVSTVVFVPLFVAGPKHDVTGMDGFYIAYAGLGASIAAPLLWMLGTSRLGAARVSLFFNLVPIVTALLAAVFLGEAITWSVAIGGALAIAGVVMAELTKLARVAAQDAPQGQRG